ncbi:hypothetical protein [Bradyrhizobium elkanii]|uniref:HTH OST-type domain-containing protein n=1 Tax=Bradyrhizobium elkanii TaxID=29448 RepID=A0ABV4EV30_BRAEL|nr:hypothetical protein [Bradyrhizobium elkanii]MCP1755705.1 hypothetical protein [Bradyrhizobium elkanii]MCP1981221.1 hypothetical protein [Bradyrhizobium elkanii]MCS3689443.1 hypothetical protein [Bradyrhizobium elkanii]MCS3883998.1 hypothetical protein [Bradyrhizobium elkanii]MCS4216971.1 hypothetical protein [Bradyrhizobium elkanii]
MSFQLTVLKVLAGQPGGRASVAEVRRAVEILMNSGRDWTDRMKRLAEHAPDLNIFSAKFVFRDAFGWEITEDGRQFLSALERAVADQRESPRSTIDSSRSEVAAQAVTDAAKSLSPAVFVRGRGDAAGKVNSIDVQHEAGARPGARRAQQLTLAKVLSISRGIDQNCGKYLAV